MDTSKDDFVGNRSISQVRRHRWETGWCKLAFMFCGVTMALLMVMWATPKTAAAQSDIIFSAPDRTVATSDVTVTVPISLSTPAGVTLAGFRVELTYDATKLAVASCTLVHTGFCNSNTSGTILFNAANFSGIADGTVATIAFTVTAGATGASALSMRVSQVLDTSLADLTSRAVAQNGSVTIGGGIEPGNCNSDSLVDAGDISALILEIFDGDGNQIGDAAGGTFAGSDGCDTNLDTLIDAGDISCLILLIFNGPDACTTTITTAGTLAPAQLQVTTPQAVDRGSDIIAAISLTPGDHVVTAAVFAFTFDPQRFTINPNDADANGIPDAITLHTATGQSAQATVDKAEGRVTIAMFDNTRATATPLADRLAEITLTAKGSAAPSTGSSALTLTESSLGDADGAAVALTVHSGSVQIGEAAQSQQLYLPFIANRD